MGYAEYTTVPAENSRAEIERVICQYAGREAEISTFEEEFLAHIVSEDGKTIYEKIQLMEGKRLLPALEKSVHSG
jgi:hypothetical protein